jgi:hypothetical protein
MTEPKTLSLTNIDATLEIISLFLIGRITDQESFSLTNIWLMNDDLLIGSLFSNHVGS